jgi:hypothetical protein
MTCRAIHYAPRVTSQHLIRVFRQPAARRVIVLATTLFTIAALTAWALLPSAIQREANRARAHVAAIRGLEFRRHVPVEKVTTEQMRRHLAAEFAKAPVLEHHWAVMRLLGVYRGPDLGPPAEVYLNLYGFAGGLYDVHRGTFLINDELGAAERAVGIAHELHHALQDQHYDLNRFFIEPSLDPNFDGDELMARQALVEGEAAYVDSIYQLRVAGNDRPSRTQIREVIASQGEWNIELWEQALADPLLAPEMRDRVRSAIEARKLVPPFIFELMMTAYIDGMTFIEAIYDPGWREVNALWRDYPPISTEQVLHPEKWRAREEPVRFAWPAFDSSPLFAEWQSVAENTVGERVWQFVFREHGLRAEAMSAAAGWNGDRFAIFKRRNAEEFLLLMCTSWDTTADAEEFAAAYSRLLESKYPDGMTPTRIRVDGAEVRIVEGGTAATLDAFVAFNASANATIRAPKIVRNP